MHNEMWSNISNLHFPPPTPSPCPPTHLPTVWGHPTNRGKPNSGPHPQKRTIFLPQQLSAANGVSGGWTWRTPPPKFWLAWSCSSNLSGCEFMSVTAVLPPEDSSSQRSSPSGFYILPPFPWFKLFLWSQHYPVSKARQRHYTEKKKNYRLTPLVTLEAYIPNKILANWIP